MFVTFFKSPYLLFMLIWIGPDMSVTIQRTCIHVCFIILSEMISCSENGLVVGLLRNWTLLIGDRVGLEVYLGYA